MALIWVLWSVKDAGRRWRLARSPSHARREWESLSLKSRQYPNHHCPPFSTPRLNTLRGARDMETTQKLWCFDRKQNLKILHRSVDLSVTRISKRSHIVTSRPGRSIFRIFCIICIVIRRRLVTRVPLGKNRRRYCPIREKKGLTP